MRYEGIAWTELAMGLMEINGMDLQQAALFDPIAFFEKTLSDLEHQEPGGGGGGGEGRIPFTAQRMVYAILRPYANRVLRELGLQMI